MRKFQNVTLLGSVVEPIYPTIPSDHVECGRNEDTDDAKGQEGGIELGGAQNEPLFAKPCSAREKTEAKNQQDITQDGADERRLDDAELAFHKGKNGDNQFDGVSEGGIQ